MGRFVKFDMVIFGFGGVCKFCDMIILLDELLEFSKNLFLLMWFFYGVYYFVVCVDSDIEVLDDFEGVLVFLGF